MALMRINVILDKKLVPLILQLLLTTIITAAAANSKYIHTFIFFCFSDREGKPSAADYKHHMILLTYNIICNGTLHCNLHLSMST
jgi:hypothetical protein